MRLAKKIASALAVVASALSLLPLEEPILAVVFSHLLGLTPDQTMLITLSASTLALIASGL